MGLREEMKTTAARLLADPRVLKLMQSEQLVRALTLLVQIPEKVGEISQEQGAKFAKNFHLASVSDLERLEQRIVELEAEVAQLRQNRAGH